MYDPHKTKLNKTIKPKRMDAQKAIERLITTIAEKVALHNSDGKAERDGYEAAFSKALDSSLPSNEAPSKVLSKAQSLQKNDANMKMTLIKYLKYRRLLYQASE